MKHVIIILFVFSVGIVFADWKIVNGNNVEAVNAHKEDLQLKASLKDSQKNENSVNWLYVETPLNEDSKFIIFNHKNAVSGKRWINFRVVDVNGKEFDKAGNYFFSDVESPVSIFVGDLKNKAGKTFPADAIPAKFQVAFSLNKTPLEYSITNFKQQKQQKKPADFFVKNTFWQMQFGPLVHCNVSFNSESNETEFFCIKVNPQNKGANEWVLAECQIQEDSLKDASGIEFQLKRNIHRNTYFEARIKDKNGDVFTYCQDISLNEKYRLVKLNFNHFKNRKDPKLKVVADKISTISFVFVLNATDTLTMRNFKAIRNSKIAKAEGTISVIAASSNPSNLFEANQDCILNFAGQMPQGATSLQCQVTDYFGKNIYSKPLTDIRIPLNLGKLPSGYYEVRIFPVLSDGRIAENSCIKTPGWENIPGLATFAVMPCTKAENIQDMKKYGENSFFGLMHKHYNFQINEMMGVSWLVEGHHWKWTEFHKQSPVVDGLSTWVYEKKNGKRPDYLCATLSFSPMDSQAPKWNQGKYNFIEFANNRLDSPEFMQYIKNVVTLHKYQYSHMKNRIYEITWEPDLGCVPFGKNTINDIVNYYKRVVPYIKSIDPDAHIYGPKATLLMPWIREAFNAGIGNYLDGVSGHFYTTSLPEEGGLPEKIAEYRYLIEKHTKKPMKIFNTEGGYCSEILGINNVHEQARRDLRYALIMNGEKIDCTMLFFIFDFSGEKYKTWGIFFTDNPKGHFDVKRLMPKAAVSAYATAAWLLRGAKPLMNLRWIDTDTWGYVFLKDKKTIIPLWHPYEKKNINFPVGNVKAVTVVDIMGRPKTLPVNNGIVSLEISPDIIYLLDSDPEIWHNEFIGKTPNNGINPVELYRGAVTEIPIEFKKGMSVETSGSVKAQVDNNKITISTPADAKPGIIPITIISNTKKQILYAKVNPPLLLKETRLLAENNQLFLLAPIVNPSSVPAVAQLQLITPSGIYKDTQKFSKKSEKTIKIPIQKITEEFNPLVPFQGTFQMSVDGQIIRKKLFFSFLATKNSEKKERDPIYTNTITIKGKGASGIEDVATIKLQSDKKFLKIHVTSQDDVFYQPHSNDSIWMCDSLQIAFDTDPDNSFEYDPLTARVSKKVTLMGIAMTDKGVYAHRYLTFNEKILKTGNITEDIPVTIERNGNRTIYDINIPWKEIGFSAQEIASGKKMGFSLLVNDSDGQKTNRAIIPLFGGIYDNSGWRNFGIVNLQ